MIRILLCGSLFCCLSLPATVAAQKPPARPGSSYVGSDICQPCHDDVSKTVLDSAHGNLMESRDATRHGCESCHGPGSAHVNGNGDASKIIRFSDARADTVRTRCGECHQAVMGEGAGHQKMSCLECHSIHHFQQQKFVLILGKEKLCQRCH
jgi:hypothetical protein